MFKPNPAGELICKDSELLIIPKDLCEESEKVLLLDLRGNGLNTLANSVIFKFFNLKVLDVRANHLEVISEEISYLWNLKELRLDNNNLTGLPIQLFQLPCLTILSISKNFLVSIPEIIYKLRKLQNLCVASNQIKEVPSSLLKMTRLQELYIQNNYFFSVPTGLFQLNLQELGLEWFDYITPVQAYSSLKQNFPKDFSSTHVTFMDFLKIFNPEFESSDILYRAIHRGDSGVIAGLIHGNVDLNSFDIDGYSPLMVSIKQDKIQISKMLFKAGASFKYGAGNYGSILHIAVYKSEIWLIEKLIEANVDVNIIDAEGNTPLHILMGIFGKQKHKSKRIGDLLMSKKAKVNVYNHENWAPMHLAARKGHSSALKWIVHQNKLSKTIHQEIFDINIKGGSLNWVPLHLASHSNDFKSVEILINAGADVCIKNLEGKTAKDTCKGNIALYKYLLKLEIEQRKMFIKRSNCAENPLVNYWEKTAADGNCLHLKYQKLYDLYELERFEEIKEMIKSEKEEILINDAMDLLGKRKIEIVLTEGNERYSGKVMLENSETDLKFRTEVEQAKIEHDLIGPKVKNVQPSIVCSRILAVDDE